MQLEVSRIKAFLKNKVDETCLSDKAHALATRHYN